MARTDRYDDTVFAAYSVAAPQRPTTAPTSQAVPAPTGRTNRHTGRPGAANGAHGTVAHVDVGQAVRSLARAPVVVPAAVCGLAGVLLTSVTGAHVLLALPAPILAGLVWAAYGLGRARGRDEEYTRAALEAGPGARLALEAAQSDRAGHEGSGGVR